MTKKLLPAMIGLALAGGMSVAAADVTLTGFIDTSLNNDSIDDSAAATPGVLDDTTLDCNTCAIGVKGSEDLGNGLKAIFKLDWQFDADERVSGGSLTDRDQWLGLAGNFGKIRIGTISTVYKSHGAKLDPFYRTSIQGRDRGLQSNWHNGANGGNQAFPDSENRGRSVNTVRWDSKNFSGLKIGATYAFDEGDQPSDSDDIFGIGASYQVNDNAMVFVDYIDDQEGTPSATDVDGEDSAFKIGGKIGFDNINVMAQYEQISDYTGGIAVDEEIWHLGASLTMGNNLFYAGYGQGDGDRPNSDYDAFTIAAKHSMSKQTLGYIGYTSTDCSAGAENGSSLHSACSKVNTGNGGNNDRFTLGLRHKF